MLTWKTEQQELLFKMQQEWPDRFLELSQLERTVKSPEYGNQWTKGMDWGQRRQHNPSFQNFVHTNYRSYSVILHLTSEVVQKVRKEGKLVVQIETDTQEGEVHVEEGIHNWAVFKSSNIGWEEAEERCVGYGGHLASVTDRSEIIAADNCWIGLKGTKAEGWRWTDCSTWNFTNWGTGISSKTARQIKSDRCVKTLKDGSWSKTGCTINRLECFVCGFKRHRKTLYGQKKLTLEYGSGELPLPLINITFVYNASQPDTKFKIKSQSKIPGFRVTWGTLENTSEVKEAEGKWKNHLFHSNQREVSFLLTASLLRAGATLKTLMDGKEEYMKDVIGCKEGYLPQSVYLGLLEHLKKKLNTSMSINDVYPRKRAIQKSFRAFLLLIQCSEEDQKALQFINNYKDTPGTLLQATVNTLNKNRFQENSTRVEFS